jgi:alginate export protein
MSLRTATMALLGLATGVNASAQDDTSPVLQTEDKAELTLAEALAAGTSWVKLRLRFENVDQQSFAKDANSFTLRTLLGYETAAWNEFSLLIEAEDVSEIGAATFNNTYNGVTDRPVVADPDGTEVNQAYVQYSGLEDTVLRAGRQRIILNDARFVGNVGWRQNEQTFDAWSAKSEAIEGLDIFYAHITNANRIFGDGSPIGNAAMASNLLHLGHDFGDIGRLEAFLYDLDYTDQPSGSTRTVGASFIGRRDLENVGLLYRIVTANQTDANDNPNQIDAGYLQLEGGVEASGITIKIGQELLEGSGSPGDRFTTPLATLHGWNGWADMFLNTPDAGLEDTYVSIGGNWRGTNLLAVWHDFGSDAGSVDYGTELDLRATRKLSNGIVCGLKYADYSADSFGEDTTKGWFWLAYSF